MLHARVIPIALAGALLVCAGFTKTFQAAPLDRPQMRELLVQLGYEVKDLETEAGKEKYQVTLTRDGLNIPIGAEISPSGGYIWLTVFLKADLPDDRAAALLKRTAETQPTMFYITKSNKLMCGLPVENRGVTNTILRQRIEKLAGDVGKSQPDWK